MWWINWCRLNLPVDSIDSKAILQLLCWCQNQWLMELPYWFTANFLLIFSEILATRSEKDFRFKRRRSDYVRLNWATKVNCVWLLNICHITQYSQKLNIRSELSGLGYVYKLSRFISSKSNCIYVSVFFSTKFLL